MVIASSAEVTIRRMEAVESDFGLFLGWMSDPETMRYWEGFNDPYTYERVVKNYRDMIEEGVEQCIIEYRARPIGFCQFCVLNADYFEVPREEYDRYTAPGELVYGIDIFIGEVALRNRGIGTESLGMLVKALFEKCGADVVMIDPKTHNTRAIRCYEKVGFRPYFVVPKREELDGVLYDSLIMGIRNAEYIDRRSESV